MQDGHADKNPYCSVDPAPPAARKSVPELRSALLDESLPLFDRYRAMFALRNLGTEEAVLALGDGKVQLYGKQLCEHLFHSAVIVNLIILHANHGSRTLKEIEDVVTEHLIKYMHI